MNRKILLLVLFCFILLPSSMSAALNFDTPKGEIKDVPAVINSILTPIWQIFVGLAVIMFIFAGIMFLTAQGDPEKLKTARHAVLWGAIGIVVGIIAFSIVAIVTSAIK